MLQIKSFPDTFLYINDNFLKKVYSLPENNESEGHTLQDGQHWTR